VIAAFLAVPVADAAAAKRLFGDRSLGPGSRGRDVRVLQDFLTRVGLRTTVDGHYGPATTRRVRSWERRAARRVNGRMSRPDARVLRSQVEATGATQAAPAPAPAPAPPPLAPGDRATLLPDGTAVAPASAPAPVKAIIAAANAIHDKPYRYGGGHGRWEDTGYDCSGSMSYALRGAGLLDTALDSSGFMRFGDPGPGRWVTIYSHPGHGYLMIAGLRYDTSGRADDDTRWDTRPRSTAGYAVRHPPGL